MCRWRLVRPDRRDGTLVASRPVGGSAAGVRVRIVDRDSAKARALADKLAAGATTGTYGAAPAGDIVILGVLYTSAAAAVADYGDALDGKVIIDITNPVSPDATGLVTPQGSSGAQEIAKGAPAGAHVVKAFNTIFGHVLAKGAPHPGRLGSAGSKVMRRATAHPQTTRRKLRLPSIR